MFTPQEVSEKVFPKASFGGYNMASVDEFLDTLTEDYTSLYKENAALKAKLKVLAEKVEEYRATEDAMRSTLLTAQKMAAQLVQEAQVEKQQILDEAKEAAAQQIVTLDTQTAQAQQKLDLAQQKLADFIVQSQSLCAAQLDFLKTLPEIHLATPQLSCDTIAEDAARNIEQDILDNFAQPAAEPVPEAKIEEEPEEEPSESAEAQGAASERPISADFNLDDLKFGRNYGNDNE